MKTIGTFKYGGFKVLLRAKDDESQFIVSSWEDHRSKAPSRIRKETDLAVARLVFEEQVENCLFRTSLSMVADTLQS